MKNNWMYALIVLAGGTCFGILSTFVKLGYENGLNLTQIVMAQFLAGILILGGMLVFSKKHHLSLKTLLALFACGVPTGLTGVFYYHSLQTLDASLAVIFLFQFVWIGSLYEYLFSRKKPTKKRILSIAILIGGSILAAGVLQSTVQFNWIGAAWAMLGAFCSALFMYMTGTIGTTVPVVQKSFIISIGGFITSGLLLLPTLNSFFAGGIQPALVGIGLLIGLFGVVLPPLLFSIGMPKVGSGLGAILSTAELPVALILSIFLLHETVRPLQWLGVAIIFTGIAIGNVEWKQVGIMLKQKHAN
ncbi:EamA family transporter [Shouchella patagoniensis]|uniref:EamA family transporter n=1 Tax=Shouchella patagoniensis TaxID=228576 RepID=UPI0009951AE9|nr:DMT family transporter [Shouchella patagoniensis]